MFIATTNTYNAVNIGVTYHPYKEGDTICNIYYPTDCITVKNGVLPIALLNGEVKIFLPKGSFSNETQVEEEETMLLQ